MIGIQTDSVKQQRRKGIRCQLRMVSNRKFVIPTGGRNLLLAGRKIPALECLAFRAGALIIGLCRINCVPALGAYKATPGGPHDLELACFETIRATQRVHVWHFFVRIHRPPALQPRLGLTLPSTGFAIRPSSQNRKFSLHELSLRGRNQASDHLCNAECLKYTDGIFHAIHKRKKQCFPVL
jgi:hypothetical protein